MLKHILVCIAAGTLTIGASAFAAEKTEAEKAISEAKAAQEVAQAAHGEWRDTGDMLADAEKALEGGDFVKAAELADKARFQFETGAAQAEEQKDAGNPPYL